MRPDFKAILSDNVFVERVDGKILICNQDLTEYANNHAPPGYSPELFHMVYREIVDDFKDAENAHNMEVLDSIR